MPWQPLTDIWDNYHEVLSEADKAGLMDDPADAEDFVWPYDLAIGEEERDDIRQFVTHRMTEIVETIQRSKGVDPNLIAGYVFRSLLSGMMWERERIGK